MPRVEKHQTMRSNVPAESPKNYYLRNLYYPFVDSMILQLDQRFSGHVKAVMRLSSLLPANKAQLLLWQRFCQNHSDVLVWKRAYHFCQPDIFPAKYYSVISRHFQYLLQLPNDRFLCYD